MMSLIPHAGRVHHIEDAACDQTCGQHDPDSPRHQNTGTPTLKANSNSIGGNRFHTLHQSSPILHHNRLLIVLRGDHRDNDFDNPATSHQVGPGCKKSPDVEGRAFRVLEIFSTVWTQAEITYVTAT